MEWVWGFLGVASIVFPVLTVIFTTISYIYAKKVALLANQHYEILVKEAEEAEEHYQQLLNSRTIVPREQ